MRVVVCSVAGTHEPGELPESRFAERRRISGGERTLYELAAAAAQAGFDVELRGVISEPVYREITQHSAGPNPTVGLPARPATGEDLVVVPEGGLPPQTYASVCFSPARAVMLLLGPPGLCGPSFLPGWTEPDWFSISPQSVGTPEQFRAIAALGFELWSNSPEMSAAAERAHCSCVYIGTGTPVPFPVPPAERPHTVVFVSANRWAPAALEVAERAKVKPYAIPELFDTTVSAELAQGRILIWPSRVEGASRIQREARAVGTVPVALSSNIYAACMDETSGAVVVDTLDQMAEQIRHLIDDDAAWYELSKRGMATARAQSDWGSYMARVQGALLAAQDRPPAETPARVLGTNYVRLAEQHHAQDVQIREAEARALQGRTEILHARIESLQPTIQALEAKAAASEAEAGRLGAEMERLERELQHCRQLVNVYRSRRAIRIADAVRRALRSVLHKLAAHPGGQ